MLEPVAAGLKFKINCLENALPILADVGIRLLKPRVKPDEKRRVELPGGYKFNQRKDDDRV